MTLRRCLIVLAVAWLAGSTAPMALAQAPASAVTPNLLSPATAPDQSGAIPLGKAPGAGTQTEQWENFHGELSVRNVTAPTLTPILPDPSKATGAAVIVAPGGAFMFLSMDNEGYKVAHWLADHGIAAFILKYRTRETPREPKDFMAALSGLMKNVAQGSAIKLETPPEALADAEAAVRLVRSRAQAWHVDPARVGFVGFSAGAMTTLSVGLIEDKASRPDFIASIYGPLNAQTVPADAPPMFLAVALDDPLMAKGKSLELIDSWRNAGVPVEAHLYGRGGHGFGMAHRSDASALWIDEFYAWMDDRKLVKPAS